MKYDIRHPITETEKTTILIDPEKRTDNVYVSIHVGQEPTLTDMYDTLIWAAQNLTPLDVEFEIDPTFAGEEEYRSVFQYLSSAGFTVRKPNPQVVNVPVFNEEEVMAKLGDTVPTVPDEKHQEPSGKNIVMKGTKEEDGEGASYGGFEDDTLASYCDTRDYILAGSIILGAILVSAAILFKKG